MIETDYYFIQPLLMDYIEQNIADFRGIYSGYQLAGLRAGNFTGAFPCCFVEVQNDDIIEVAEDGLGEVISQTWVTSVGVQNVTQLNQSGSRSEEAGPIISKLRNLLGGWAVPNTDNLNIRFRRINAPSIEYYPAGVGIFPVAWSINLETGDY